VVTIQLVSTGENITINFDYEMRLRDIDQLFAEVVTCQRTQQVCWVTYADADGIGNETLSYDLVDCVISLTQPDRNATQIMDRVNYMASFLVA